MIRLVTDTTCGIPLSQLKPKGIEVLPQIITFEDKSFRDDYEIDTATFLNLLKNASKLPGTAAPPPALYSPIYKKCIKSDETILVLTPSSEVSGTFRSATIAATEFPDADIHIIDTRTVAGGFGTMVLQAQRLIDEGLSIEEIKSHVLTLMKRERVFFIVDTLEYLYKGGRIGGASALIGSIFQIKPILTIGNGKVQPFDKQRTFRQALESIKKRVIDLCNNNPEPLLNISHCEAESIAIELAEYFVKELNLSDVPIYLLPPAIVVHGGPGIIEVCCFEVNLTKTKP